MYLLKFTFERAGHIGLSDVVVLESKRLAGVGRVGDVPRGVGLQVVSDNGHRRATREIGLAKNVGHVLILLWIEILYTGKLV